MNLIKTEWHFELTTKKPIVKSRMKGYYFINEAHITVLAFLRITPNAQDDAIQQWCIRESILSSSNLYGAGYMRSSRGKIRHCQKIVKLRHFHGHTKIMAMIEIFCSFFVHISIAHTRVNINIYISRHLHTEPECFINWKSANTFLVLVT